MAKLRDPFTPDQKIKWKDLVSEVKEDFEFCMPVHIWRVNTKGKRWKGIISTDGTRFWIRISRYQEFSDAVYSLIEEVSHALCYPIDGFKDERTSHGSHWGLCYSYVREKIFDILDWEGENVTVVEKE